MAKRLIPSLNRVPVEKIILPSKTSNGISLPKKTTKLNSGKVVAVGPRAWDREGKLIPVSGEDFLKGRRESLISSSPTMIVTSSHHLPLNPYPAKPPPPSPYLPKPSPHPLFPSLSEFNPTRSFCSISTLLLRKQERKMMRALQRKETLFLTSQALQVLLFYSIYFCLDISFMGMKVNYN